MANYQKLDTVDRVSHDGVETFTTAKIGGAPPTEAVPIGWPADGRLHISDPVAPQQRSQWQTGILSCFGTGDEFYSADLEVCLLGTVAPCVIHGSNAERISAGSGSFASHCLPYTGLFLLGNCFFGWNCLAPWFSYHVRTAIRHRFNLEGTCEAAGRLCSCCGGMAMNEAQQEQCETACDFATHMFCHACAICQEAREVRRRLPHPAYNSQTPILFMVPPSGQTMGRS